MKKILLICLLLIFFLFFFWIESEPEPLKDKNRRALQNAPSLKQTFEKYIQAIHQADLEALFETVSEQTQFLFLTAHGTRIVTRKGYYQFHQRWFQEENWSMPVELIEVHEGRDYGYTVALFHYRQRLPSGEWYCLDSYFTLIFRKERGKWKVVADICTPVNEYYQDDGSTLMYTADQKYLLDIIRNRRTVRKFKSTPVPREHILKILNAARFAPTAGNQQPWKFLVIQDREKLDKLKKEALFWTLEAYQKKKKPQPEELEKVKESLQKILKNALSAPVYVAVLVDKLTKYPEYIIYDGSLAAGYLMIAARSLGYGTGFFTTFFPEAKMKKFFNIPDRYKLICFTPIGVPEEWPATPPKKPLKEVVVFESFQK